jgi:hypothetical protein
MPAVKLSFNLPEEQDQFEDALDGSKWKIFAQEFSQVLKGHLKYEYLDYAEKVEAQRVSDLFYQLLEDSDLDLWD